ncbi:MAG: DUF3226 domain-containing protein [Phototrophicaceae bacterium]
MSKNIERTRLLLVEGVDDIKFFQALCHHLFGEKYSATLQIMSYDGKDHLEKLVKALQERDDYFDDVTHLGIVRDADFTGGALQSVQNILKGVARKQLSIPEQHNQFVGTDPSVGIFIMPSGNRKGMLETLVLDALQSDEIIPCVEDYFACIERKGIIPKEEPLDKARLAVYQASAQLRMRTYIEGKNVHEEALAKDRKRSSVDDIYKMKWWSWDSPAFDEVKAFLRELFTAP